VIDPKLLADILDKPIDDGPRLVAADALQEKGDPRGLFITAQIQLAEKGLPKLDRRTLKTQSADLLKKHKAEWTGHIPKGVQHVVRRGFVDEIDGDAGQIAKHGASIFSSEPVLRLKIRNASADKITELANIGAFRRLTHLTVNGKLGDKGAKALADALAPRSGDPLLSLNVGSTGIGGPGASHLIGVLTGCRSLFFTNNELADEGASAIANAKTLSSLEALFLTNNNLTDEGVEELAKSSSLGALRRLGLARNEEVTTDSLAKIAASKKLRRLRWLEYDEDGMQSIATRG